MQALEDRQRIAAEYRAWLDSNPPDAVGHDAWEAKWRLYRQVTEEIALLTGNRRCGCPRDDLRVQVNLSRVLRSQPVCTRCGLPLEAA